MSLSKVADCFLKIFSLGLVGLAVASLSGCAPIIISDPVSVSNVQVSETIINDEGYKIFVTYTLNNNTDKDLDTCLSESDIPEYLLVGVADKNADYPLMFNGGYTPPECGLLPANGSLTQIDSIQISTEDELIYLVESDPAEKKYHVVAELNLSKQQ